MRLRRVPAWLLAAAVLALCVGAAAYADDPAVPDTPNTPYTPEPQQYDDNTSPWQYVGGLRFDGGVPQPAVPKRSATPADVNFYAVAFTREGFGFAGGSTCGPTTDLLAPQSCADPRPVMWRYSAASDGSLVWSKDTTFPGGDSGFVGAIAFYPDTDHAIAVGGSGRYPYTEPAPGEEDPAGHARAWEFDQGQWHELSGLDGMNALTALAFSPRPDDCTGGTSVCGFAGGLHQLWRWTDDGFSTTPEAVGINYRVRSIAFTPGEKLIPRSTNNPDDVHAAFAVTTGCCAEPTSTNRAQVLDFDRKTWRPILDGTNTNPTLSDAHGLSDSFYAVEAVTQSITGWPFISLVLSPGEDTGAGAQMPASVAGTVGPSGGTPGFDVATGTDLPALSSPWRGDVYQLANPRIMDVSLAAGDGDTVSAPSASTANSIGARNTSPRPGADGYIDWAVGRFRANGEAAAYTTTTDPHVGIRGEVPDPIDCQGQTLSGAAAQNPTACKPDTDGVQDKEKSKALFELPTFGLNAYTITESGGVGWAVGDHGAIMKLGAASAAGAGGAGAEPSAPSLGARQEAPLADTAAYNAFAPLGSAGEAGLVPPLIAQPHATNAGMRVVSGGSPDPDRLQNDVDETVSSIATSRDGSEAWAVGSFPIPGQGAPPALFHYLAASGWRRCAMTPQMGKQLPSDPACQSLAGFTTYKEGGSPSGVDIIGIARVPTEANSDPTDDDDFQAVAFGTGYAPASGNSTQGVLIRYQNGRWDIDAPASKQLALDARPGDQTSIAFTSPTDGWIATTGAGTIRHFDGTSWVRCGQSSPKPGDNDKCLDPGARLQTFAARPQFVRAGTRLYAYGNRAAGAAGVNTSSANLTPLILYRDSDKPCGAIDDPGCWHSANGGLDAVKDGNDSDPEKKGELTSLSVAQNRDGSYSGWGVGLFGQAQSGQAALLHLEGGSWTAWGENDASSDYLLDPGALPVSTAMAGRQVLALPGTSEGRAILLTGSGDSAANMRGPMLEYKPGEHRWTVLPAPFSLIPNSSSGSPQALASIYAITSDNQGGAWLAVRHQYPIAQDDAAHGRLRAVFFYHYTGDVQRPVFEDSPHPIREPITASAAGGDGSFWVATAGDRLYRHDRLGGWSRVRLLGWDVGRVTRASQARAIAVGSDGTGVVVGEGGRIADLSPRGAVLDAAAGVPCLTSSCRGTTRELTAAAVAPDGSVLVAGLGRALLFRHPGGDFTSVAPPPVPPTTRFTDVSFPTPDRAWLTTTTGAIVSGTRSGDDWSWVVENLDTDGRPLNRGPIGISLGLQAIALDASGRGYAVGDHGLVLERTGDGAQPWRRLDTGYLSTFWSVALPVGGGRGAVIGGEYGLILTYADGRFVVAHEADPYDGLTAGPNSAAARVVGLAVLPGYAPGDVEAWAAQQVPYGGSQGEDQGTGARYNRSPAPQSILHYTSNPGDPLLGLDSGVKPLPDVPEPRAGELTFAAFGKSECMLTTTCPEPAATNLVNDLVSRRIADELAAENGGPAGPGFAIFTGDVGDTSGSGGQKDGSLADLPTWRSIVHDNWRDLIANRLSDAGLPLFAALGGQDLSRARVCAGSCNNNGAVLNQPWRQTFADMPAPWGAGDKDAPGNAGLTFAKIEPEKLAGQDSTNPTGGAHTHYALDVKRGDKPVLRLVVLDSSRGSLTSSSAEQNPIGSQLDWLTNVLKRPAGERAVVVSETPTYSYGPQATTGTLTESAAFEALLFQNRVDAVIQGKLGWNGLYWATAAGVHEPCPGGAYPERAPDPNTATPCSATTGTAGAPDPSEAAGQLAATLQGAGAPPVPAPVDPTGTVNSTNATGLIPFVVASSAGGKFSSDNPGGADPAGQGYWHGYTIVRLSPDGNPANTVVEQRPLFDWISLTAPSHVLKAGQHMQLDGQGREPVGIDAPIQYDKIRTPAITHRYDLVLADPQKPWLPQVDEALVGDPAHPHGYTALGYMSNGSACADPVACIDQQTGEIKAGRGNHPRVYTIALLSVGDKVASWPVVFEPRRSFVAKPPQIIQAPAIPPLRPPAIRVLSNATEALPSQPPPSTPVAPNVQNLNFPTPPAIPSLPPLNAATPTPPPPPAPPPPPSSPPQSGLNLTLNIAGLNVPPPSSPIPPPSPPIQPAPPGGARREARQRQAAAAKSEEGGGGEGARDDAQGRIDAVDSPNASMTRRDRIKPGQSFTSYTRVTDQQPSAWTIGLQWGGGLTLMALTLAFGYITVRPTPRRRTPELPAPAWSRWREPPR